MRPNDVLRQLAGLRGQIERYQEALKQIRDLPSGLSEPEEEDYDDMESAYGNGVDVGTYEAYQQAAQIAREALK